MLARATTTAADKVGGDKRLTAEGDLIFVDVAPAVCSSRPGSTGWSTGGEASITDSQATGSGITMCALVNSHESRATVQCREQLSATSRTTWIHPRERGR